MPIRIYTNAPARQLMEDRPFGIAGWTDGSYLGEVYAIVYMADGRIEKIETRAAKGSADSAAAVAHESATQVYGSAAHVS